MAGLNAGASEWVPSFGGSSGGDDVSAANSGSVSLPYYDGGASLPQTLPGGLSGMIDSSQLDPNVLAQLLGAAGGLDLGALLAALPQLPGAIGGAGAGGSGQGMPGLPGSSQSNMMMASGPFGAAGIARQERDHDAENLEEIELAMQQAEIEAFLDSQGVVDPDERNRMMLELMQELREEGGGGAGLLPVPGVDSMGDGMDDPDGPDGLSYYQAATEADYNDYSGYQGAAASASSYSTYKPASSSFASSASAGAGAAGAAGAAAAAKAAVTAKMNSFAEGYAANLMAFASPGMSGPVASVSSNTNTVQATQAGYQAKILGANDSLFASVIPSGTGGAGAGPRPQAVPQAQAPAPAPVAAAAAATTTTTAAAPASAPAPAPAAVSKLSSASVSFHPAGADMWGAFGGQQKR